MVRLKRAYDGVARGARKDGYCVLVERLWPRGVKKTDLVLDAWLKEVAPSRELRSWYAHDLDRWKEFERRYLDELHASAAAGAVRALAFRARKGTVTLVFATHDAEHSSAAVLKRAVERLAAKKPAPAAKRTAGPAKKSAARARGGERARAAT